MTHPTLTCAAVDEQDLDTRYLAGRLDEALAEAFEAHYLGCERCWALVRGGLEVRAARRRAPRGGRMRAARWPLALAAGVALAALGIWRLRPSPAAPAASGLRGPSDSLALRSGGGPGALTLSWAPVPHADLYRVRLYDARGTLLFARETRDTAVRVPRGDGASAAADKYWAVVALDTLRNVIARSGVVRAAAPPPAR